MSTEETQAVWVLEGFSKADEFLRTQFPISREQILRLRDVVKPDADDPWMLYCYAVPVEVWPELDAILHCGPPDPELDYQTCAYAAESAVGPRSDAGAAGSGPWSDAGGGGRAGSFGA